MAELPSTFRTLSLCLTFFSIRWRNHTCQRGKNEAILFQGQERPSPDPCCLTPLSLPPHLTLPVVAPPLPDVDEPSAKGARLVVMRPLMHDRWSRRAVEHDK